MRMILFKITFQIQKIRPSLLWWTWISDNIRDTLNNILVYLKFKNNRSPCIWPGHPLVIDTLLVQDYCDFQDDGLRSWRVRRKGGGDLEGGWMGRRVQGEDVLWPLCCGSALMSGKQLLPGAPSTASTLFFTTLPLFSSLLPLKAFPRLTQCTLCIFIILSISYWLTDACFPSLSLQAKASQQKHKAHYMTSRAMLPPDTDFSFLRGDFPFCDSASICYLVFSLPTSSSATGWWFLCTMGL